MSLAKPQRAKTRCPTHGKWKWRTSLDAALALERLGNTGRHYRCPDCGYWHVTRGARRTPPGP